jgi:hypothetical protein
MQSVGANQTVTDSGNQDYCGEHGVVQIDAPSLYQRSRTLVSGR